MNDRHNFPSKFLETLLLLAALSGCSQKSSEIVNYDSLSIKEKRLPQYATSGLTVAPDLEVTLFAAEPTLTNPTNMDIDSRGRVWVCEGYNYRPELNPGNPTKEEGDRILIMEDTNGDGTADKSTVFYQGNDVNAALGIKVLGNKAIVSCSPNVLVLTDTDGDDKADKKEILFSHIAGVQHDHAIHAFVFGPDGKLYFNFGNQGEHLMDKDGNPITEQTGTKVANEGNPYRQGMVFRVNPDGTDLEVLGHNFRNNYEVAVDAFGTLWQSDNDDDGNKGVRINYVMEYGNYGYVDAMTGEDWRTYRTGMAEEIPRRHWHLNDPGVVPNLLQTGAGSPTGMLVYEGTLLPERFRNQLIHADAGANVVRAYAVSNDGSGYTAKIIDIVKGKDQWFRPSDVCIAPDGSLFIADWYDPGVGGHQVGDLQQGRIFRVAPKDTPYKVESPDLSTPEKAVAALKNPNMSVRYLAWNKLHNWGTEAEPALQAMLSSEEPRHQAQAYWLLSKIKGKGKQYVMQALKSNNPDIRITGIRMARQLDMDIMPVLQKAAKDESPQVRREAAIALRYLDSPAANTLWAELAMQHDGKDRWYLEALGIGSDRYPDQRFAAWMEKNNDDWDTPAGRDIIWRSRSEEAVPLLGKIIESSESDTYQDRLRYFRAFDFHPGQTKQQVLADLATRQHPNQESITLLALSHMDPQVVGQSPKLKAALTASLQGVKGTQEYLEMIKKYELTNYNSDLLVLALEKSGEEIGSEATKVLLDMGGKPMVEKLLSGNDEDEKHKMVASLKRVNNDNAVAVLVSVILNQDQPKAFREDAVMALAGSWAGEDQLMELIHSGDLRSDLDSAAMQVFSMAMRSTMYGEAAGLLNVTDSLSQSTLAPVSQLVSMQGDADNGKTVFSKVCQNCHMVGEKGVDYGPALTEIGDKLPKEGLYHAILDPSAGISFGYEGYHVTLKDGSIVNGYILSKTEDELRMRMYGGLTNTYKLSNVSGMEKMDQSLMFDHLERGMSEQELVDLVTYLSGLKKGAVSMK